MMALAAIAASKAPPGTGGTRYCTDLDTSEVVFVLLHEVNSKPGGAEAAERRRVAMHGGHGDHGLAGGIGIEAIAIAKELHAMASICVARA